MLKGDSEPVREVSGPFYGFVRWREYHWGGAIRGIQLHSKANKRVALIGWERQWSFQEPNKMYICKSYCWLWIVRYGGRDFGGSSREWEYWYELCIKSFGPSSRNISKGGIDFNYFLIAEVSLWMWHCTEGRHIRPQLTIGIKKEPKSKAEMEKTNLSLSSFLKWGCCICP